MLLIVKIINGAEHSLEVAPDLTIEALKSLLSNQLNIPINQQRLMHKGKALADKQKLNDYSIESGTKIHLIIKKETDQSLIKESNLNKELKSLAKNYVTDVDQFAITFNKELKKLVNEMSLDDIERYDESKEILKKNKQTSNN